MWLFCAANTNSGVNSKTPANALKATTTKASLSTAFSSSNSEIELTAVQLFAPLHLSVEKKELLYSVLSVDHAVSGLNVNSNYSGKISAVIAANSYKLLFPFHHFW